MGEYRMFGLRRHVQYTLLAGLAGAFLIPQVSFAAPTGEQNLVGSAAVSRAGATTNIGSSDTNNVISWADYSIASGETVHYDTKNYLNLVRGGNTSAINGTLSGGGNIYLVNPNGVIIGKGATVNVGSLHVSTQEISTVNQNANMAGGVSPFSASAAGLSDVVNMGTINATSVEVIGKSIRFLNDANVTVTNSPVVLRTDTANDGTAHIGYVSGSPIAAGKYTVNNAAATAADNYYQLVRTTTEFQNINNDLAKNYMLANDIDMEGAAHTPIGGNSKADFTGKFDGNFYKVKNFTVSGVDNAGLFGKVNSARIENLGVTGATISGNTSGSLSSAGTIVALASGSSSAKTILKNVYAKDGTVQGRNNRLGGIAGYIDHTTIDSSYNTVDVGMFGGGISGSSGADTVVRDTYNNPGTANGYFIRTMQPPGSLTVQRSFTTTSSFSSTASFSTTDVTKTYFVGTDGKAKLVTPSGASGAGLSAFSAASYDWDVAINNNGAPGAKWRIYEGRTTPLLTAFMSGTATATYNYRYFNADGSADTDTGNTVKSNEGKDLTGLTYNSKYLKIVNPNAPTAAGDKSNVIYSGDVVDNNKVHDYVNAGTKDYDKTNGIRNVGTKAILWSDQDGPNLRGVNVTIDKRQVKLNNGNINPKRMYNGKSDVTDAFIKALKSGSITSDGFTAEDIASNSVQLDFTTGHFKAMMDDKNVGTNKNVTFTGSIGFTGDDKGNYEFDGGSINNLKGKATIEKAPLYIKIAHPTAADKTYDGTSTVVDDDMKQSTSPKNITLDKSKTGPTNAQVAAGQKPQDGAVMLDDSDHPDDVDLKNIADPKYTDAAGNEQIHAGDHKLQYTGVGLQGADAQNYELRYEGTERNVENETVYLDGTIIPRQILRDSFKVYNTDGTEASAQKVYDGGSAFNLKAGTYLSSNAPASGNTGIVSRDQGHITFGLTGGADFTDDNGAKTKNVKTATKIAYKVTGRTDDANLYKLSDYYILDGSPAEKKTLDKEFSATGAGKITPKSLTAAVKNNHITKVYDAMKQQTDGKRNIIKGDALVTLTGYVGSEKRTNTSTATYASKDVVVDGAGNPAAQDVTYNVSFDKGTGEESDNYTLDQTANTTNVTNTQTLSIPGVYTGTITPRDLTMKFADVTKVYDGTAENTDKTLASLDDGLSGAVIGADGITKDSITMPSGVTSSYGKRSGTTFTDNLNAGAHDVEYRGLSNALGTSNHNYKIADKQYGTGTITRRRIDPSGFQVLDKNDHIADATKVYDGTSDYNLPDRAKLVTPQAAPHSDTGIVSRDYKKITFRLKNGAPGHFTKDAAGNQQTSHVSEAQYVAYDIVAQTSDATNNPLTNYDFGTVGNKRALETVNDGDPAHVTAAGAITPAALKAVTHEISKVYDGLDTHTYGNRTAKKGETVVSFEGWVTPADTRENTSTAKYKARGAYAGKDVAYAGNNITTKDVDYTAQLTGEYADDYQIVDAANNVISTSSGSGANKTVTINHVITVADAGKITPRKLNIAMGDVSKTYDGTIENTYSSITGITDQPSSDIIGDILSDDHITESDLNTAWQTLRGAGDASSSYGRGTGNAFRGDANASNGDPHDVRYTEMDTAFDRAFGSATAGNYTVDKNVFGKGTITRRNITPNQFQVVDGHGHAAAATKAYDGTSVYNKPSNFKLSPQSGPGTGVITQDAARIRFGIDPNKGAHFTDNAGNETANTFEATRVAYHVKATTDPGDEYLLKNYTLDGQNLESGTAKVSGAGSITRRALTLGLVQDSDINKVYDGTDQLVNSTTKHWNALTERDSKGNVKYADGADKLVTTDGTSFTITSKYSDKNVAHSGVNIVDKNITYTVNIAGGDARNYTLSDGNATVDAERGLTLSATGKITPKDLSGAFKKITKVYDGTKNVNAADVGFEMGAGGVIADDNVGLASGHIESFQSENVRGDGTTTEINGVRQHNWINYSNLSLGGAQAGNYTIASTAKGLGEITPFTINAGNMRFTTSQATKIYDGTKTVKHNESAAAADVKNYIASAEVNLGTNHTPNWVTVRDKITVNSAAYDTTANVNGGASQGVTYKLTYDTSGGNGNYIVAAGTDLTATGTGVITPKTVNATINGPLTKTYDAQTTVNGAAKNGAGKVVAGADDLVTLEGLVGSDKNTTTAVYTDKNAGTGNRTVNYTITTDAADASNYTIKVNGTAVTAPYATTNNTITKRRVNLKFADVSRQYNGVSENTSITPSLSNAGDAAVLNTDHAGLVDGSNKLVGLTGIASDYGTGTTDATFTADPNAGTKSVQYRNIQSAMETALGTDADNYEFADTGYGKGRIDKAQIDGNNVHFTARDARKVYDGTTAVKHNGSSDANAVKNYISNIGVTSADGHHINLENDVEIDTENTHYSSPNATNGTPDTVTYRFRIKSNNFTNNGKDIFDATAHGTIDRRTINLDLKQKTGIDKIYDANANLADTNTNRYNKFIDDDRLGNVTYAAGTTNDGKLVRTSNGADVNDGAQMIISAKYMHGGTADANVERSGGNVTTKDINYTVKIDGPMGSNYSLSTDGGATKVNSETGVNISAQGTISPRKITLGFGDVQKMYDTTAVNADKTVNAVTVDNSDGRGAATRDADGVVETSFNMTGVTSEYGTGTTDTTFQANPNVVTDASNRVIQNGKDVQYRNLKDTLAAQSYAGNYEVADTAYGKGTITRRVVTANDFEFNINNATKMYDGTKDVVWRDTDGKLYTDMAHVKNYFSSSKLHLGGGNYVPINLDDIALNSAQYNSENVAQASGVNYGVTINTQNFEFNGSRNRTINHTGDTITKRDLATLMPKHLIKEYDGGTTFNETNRNFSEAMANEKLTTIVKRDQGKVRLAVNGSYDNKNASVDTKADAEAKTPATAGRNVTYNLTLTGDDLGNYTIGGNPTSGTVSAKGDIYKKRLTVDVARKVKDYDGTAAVKDLTAGDITFGGLVNNETLSLDQTATDKISGKYQATDGTEDANVARDANGSVVDKGVTYTGFNNALNDLASRDNTAQNYRVEGDMKTYRAADAKGRINPRTINAGDVDTTFDIARKVYDGNRKVKYGGSTAPSEVKKYLTNATVRIGSQTIDITRDVSIDEAGTSYDNKNVQHDAPHTVTYKLNYTGGNFNVNGVTKTGTGYITRKDVTATINSPLTKVYDASRDVYDPLDSSIKTYRKDNGTRVLGGDGLVTLHGLVEGDGATNATTARYDNKFVGTRKRVDYTVAIDTANADNYNIQGANGGTLTLRSNNNEITKRTLNLNFDSVQKFYDTKPVNDKVFARAQNEDDIKVLTRDSIHFGTGSDRNRLVDLNSGNIRSFYGDGRTKDTFVQNPNAGHRDVQYLDINRTMRERLGAGANQNYDIADMAFGDGVIDKATVNRSNFNFVFHDAVKEYDGTDALRGHNGSKDLRSLMNTDENLTPHSTVTLGGNTYVLPQSDIEKLTGRYRNGVNASTNNPVDYQLELNVDNYTFNDSSNGRYTESGAGRIDRRRLIADTSKLAPTKTYDGTNIIEGVAKDENGNVIRNSDGLVRYKHYSNDGSHTDDGIVERDRTYIANKTKATYADKNVAWEDYAAGKVKNKDVNYQFSLAGDSDRLSNYELVDQNGNSVGTRNTPGTTLTYETQGEGRINPVDITLKADEKTIWINDGLPKPEDYTGTPSGRNYETGVAGEVLPGTISYNSPNARLRMGDYAINGTYTPADGDTVYRNYRFVQDPANATALHVGPYIPDADYYNILAQNKMIPDEYAYENASLDRRSHFKRALDASVEHREPSLNSMQNDKNVRTPDIYATDDAVFELMNKVFH